MAPSIINNNAVQGETFLPRQIFMFGGFALRANSLGHLEQIDSYAPGRQVRFGNLNYMADIRGDLVFDGFRPTPGALNSHDEHGFDLLSDNIRVSAPAMAPGINPEQIVPFEGGWMDPATEAAHSSASEPNTDPTSCESGVIGPSDSSPAIGSEPRASVPVESDWAPVMEFSAADIFQHSPLGDVLKLLRSLSLSGDSWPNYVWLEWGADDK